jgi:hypothetical protein
MLFVFCTAVSLASFDDTIGKIVRGIRAHYLCELRAAHGQIKIIETGYILIAGPS